MQTIQFLLLPSWQFSARHHSCHLALWIEHKAEDIPCGHRRCRCQGRERRLFDFSMQSYNNHFLDLICKHAQIRIRIRTTTLVFLTGHKLLRTLSGEYGSNFWPISCHSFIPSLDKMDGSTCLKILRLVDIEMWTKDPWGIRSSKNSPVKFSPCCSQTSINGRLHNRFCSWLHIVWLC